MKLKIILATTKVNLICKVTGTVQFRNKALGLLNHTNSTLMTLQLDA